MMRRSPTNARSKIVNVPAEYLMDLLEACNDGTISGTPLSIDRTAHDVLAEAEALQENSDVL